MATIVTRSGKGSPLTNTEVDANFTNLNTDKLETSAAYVHPNHSGEVTSSADGATVIADNVVDEANLKVSNTPTNGYLLTAQSGDTGGLTWAAAPSAGIASVVADTSPELGGSLDVNGQSIVSVSNGAIDLDPNGSGKVVFKGNSTKGSGQFVLNCEANSHGITVKGPAHSAAANYTLTLPVNTGTSGYSLTTDGNGVSSWTEVVSNETHTGHVTGSGALTIADNVVDEVKLKVSNTPTNGYVLTAQSGNTGGMTWAEDTSLPLGGGTMTGALKTLTLEETKVDASYASSASTLDLSAATVFNSAPSGDVTYTFSNPPSSGTAFGFTLKVTPSATSAVTWPTSVDWAAATAPTAPASGVTDVYTFYTVDGGTTYFGFLAGAAMG